MAQFRLNSVNEACDEKEMSPARSGLGPKGNRSIGGRSSDLFFSFSFVPLGRPRFRGLLGAFLFSTFSLLLPWLRWLRFQLLCLLYYVVCCRIQNLHEACGHHAAMPEYNSLDGVIGYPVFSTELYCTRTL